MLISLDEYTKPITYYSTDDPDFDKYMENIAGPSSQKYTDDPQSFKKNLALMGKSNVRKYKRKMIIGVKNEGNSLAAMFNSFPFHAAPLALNTANNLLLKVMDPSVNNKIQVSNHPWTNGSKPAESLRSLKEDNYNRVMRHPHDNRPTHPSPKVTCQLLSRFSHKTNGACALLLLAFILFTCPFIVGPLEEKITNVK